MFGDNYGHPFTFNRVVNIVSISILMLSAKLGHYWYHFYSVFGMTRSLTGD